MRTVLDNPNNVARDYLAGTSGGSPTGTARSRRGSSGSICALTQDASGRPRSAGLEVGLDVYNFANLLNRDWGAEYLLPLGISNQNPVVQRFPLLNVVGFDQATNRYVYTVNENFGVLRRAGTRSRSSSVRGPVLGSRGCSQAWPWWPRPGGMSDPLIVFNAAALGPPFRALADSLRSPPTSLRLQQENAPSLEAIRKLTDLGRIPDVLATADVALFDALIVPKHSSWYVVFGTDALVLAYGPHSVGRADLSPEAWFRVLLSPGVRTGRSDPSIDPSGYRTLMALQLAERHYGEPGLASRLLQAMQEQYVRHAEADLSALLQAGELDYIWTYRNLARAHGLQYLELPAEVNLADPALAAWYAQATARVAGKSPGDTLVLTGAPIVFAVTSPRGAPHPEAARAFIALLLSPRGADVLRATGFDPLLPPRWSVSRRQNGRPISTSGLYQIGV